MLADTECLLLYLGGCCDFVKGSNVPVVATSHAMPFAQHPRCVRSWPRKTSLDPVDVCNLHLTSHCSVFLISLSCICYSESFGRCIRAITVCAAPFDDHLPGNECQTPGGEYESLVESPVHARELRTSPCCARESRSQGIPLCVGHSATHTTQRGW